MAEFVKLNPNTMKIPGLRHSVERVEGLVFFARMLHKIRLHARGMLPTD